MLARFTPQTRCHIYLSGLSDIVFEGGGSTFLCHRIQGGAGIYIGHSRFEMRFEVSAPLDPRRWVTMNALDEKLRVPGAGSEFGGFTPTKIDSLDPLTVRVWPSWPLTVRTGELYLLRHYTFEKHGIVMGHNTHLSLQDVTIFSFPGIGFLIGGDQHHFECLRCRITFPDGASRPIAVTADGLHVDSSKGYPRLEDCDFGYMRDAIRAELGSGLWVEGNESAVSKILVSPSLFYDPDSTRTMVWKDNRLGVDSGAAHQ